MTPEKYKFLKNRINVSFYYIRTDTLNNAKNIFKQLSNTHNVISDGITMSVVETIFKKKNDKIGFCFQVYHRGTTKYLKVDTFPEQDMDNADNYFINYPKEIDVYYKLHNLIPSYKPKKIERTI